MKRLTQPIKWHGGKNYLAKWIISQMPPHIHYVEPFFGGGSVLLQKDPAGKSEVVNDIYGDLVNFWRVLACEESFDKFVRIIEAVPFCEAVFVSSGIASGYQTDIYRAVDFFIRVRQSRQGLMKDFATLSQNRTRRGMNEQVSSWLTAINGLPEIHARLKRVVIFNRLAIDVIRQQDGPNTLYYLDPTYLHETRVTKNDYKHEMTPAQHMELLDVLSGIEGKFILSGYPSKMYSDAAKSHGWRCIAKKIDNKASSAKIKKQKTECLWMNYSDQTKEGDG